MTSALASALLCSCERCTTSPTTLGQYTYDGDGIRESKTVSGTTTHYTWDGVGGNLLQQNDGTTKTSFIYGPGGIPVEQIAGSTTTYLHHDQLGSIRLITDSAGATGTASTYTWDPYGTSVSSSGSLTSPFGFSGQYTDSESGLIYLRARYYDPTTAQFLTLDPAVDSTLAPYAYVAGNPLNGTDPSGLLEACGEGVICSGSDFTELPGAVVQAAAGAAGAVIGAIAGIWATPAAPAPTTTTTWSGPISVSLGTANQGDCAAAALTVGTGANILFAKGGKQNKKLTDYPTWQDVEQAYKNGEITQKEYQTQQKIFKQRRSSYGRRS